MFAGDGGTDDRLGETWADEVNGETGDTVPNTEGRLNQG